MALLDMVRGRGQAATSITGPTFALHYKLAVYLLIACSAFIVLEVTWSGRPIVCGTLQPIDEHFVNSCWRFGLWSRDSKVAGKLDLGSSLPTSYHYSFAFLLIQAIFFYLPYLWWSHYDRGRLQSLLNFVKEDSEDGTNRAVESFVKNINNRKCYYGLYVLCQFLNYLNVVAQIGIISLVYDLNFITYGIHAMKQWSDAAASKTAFPVFAYCKMPEFVVHDIKSATLGHCILHVNAVNEIVYLVVWFCLMLLFVVSSLDLIWRFLMACGSKPSQVFSFKIAFWFRYFSFLNTARFKYLNKKCQTSDYFVLSILSQNMDERAFRRFLSNVNELILANEQMKSEVQMGANLLHKYNNNGAPGQTEDTTVIFKSPRGTPNTGYSAAPEENNSSYDTANSATSTTTTLTMHDTVEHTSNFYTEPGPAIIGKEQTV